MSRALLGAVEHASATTSKLELRIRHVTWEADGIISLTLDDPAGAELPTWQPGAHLDIELPSGLIRQYSLCGDPRDTCRYKVAVLREQAGRGGSAEIHDGQMVGKILKVAGPRNRFELRDADDYVMIAGGIGITPLLPMIQELGDRRPWHLYYGGRSLGSMAFGEELALLDQRRITQVPQDVEGLLDLDRIFTTVGDGTAVYCCGPEALLSAVLAKAEDLGRVDQVHFERFGAAPVAESAAGSDAHADDGAFSVELAQTGHTISVASDESVLEAVRRVVPDMPSSCEEGFCGTCQTRVLSGTVDHRDQILAQSERDANDTMYICVSRAAAGCDRLSLDL